MMMGSAGRGFRGRGSGPSFRGRGGGGGRFGGRGMGRMESRPMEPSGPRDPRSLVSYIDVDAPKVRSVGMLEFFRFEPSMIVADTFGCHVYAELTVVHFLYGMFKLE